MYSGNQTPDITAALVPINDFLSLLGIHFCVSSVFVSRQTAERNQREKQVSVPPCLSTPGPPYRWLVTFSQNDANNRHYV